ncbi:hypothetical protein [Sphingomonas sp. 22176]|uniref:hypothetical protein n=1 Tax=Sphingomonas sp. 22176 TaxID=3453884 RepID=UPI003F8680A6
MDIPTPPTKFDACHLKIKRAEKHLLELQDEIQSFLAATPYLIRSKINAQGHIVYETIERNPVPLHLSTLIGDVVHNLRSSLDILATELAKLNGNISKRSLKETYFPITIDLDSLEKTRTSKISRMSKEAQDLIIKIAPHKGGRSEILYNLHHLDIADKHATLIPVGAAYASRSVGVGVGSADNPISEAYPEGIEIELSVTFQMPEVTYPLRDGSVVATIFEVGDARSTANVDVNFGLVFSGLGFFEGEPVLDALAATLVYVARVVHTFEVKFLNQASPPQSPQTQTP